MGERVENQSELMSNLSISALAKVCNDSSCWKERVFHKASLITGLSVLMGATQLMSRDLEEVGKDL